MVKKSFCPALRSPWQELFHLNLKTVEGYAMLTQLKRRQISGRDS